MVIMSKIEKIRLEKEQNHSADLQLPVTQRDCPRDPQGTPFLRSQWMF